jgi:predicted O-methyltransferase YrrM
VTATDKLIQPTQPGRVDDAQVLSRAERAEAAFVEQMRGVPYETKGVFFSEMLFVLAAAGPGFDGLVLESGRARGQSTFVLGTVFPQAKIVSIEFDRDSPDVPVAEERLKRFENIELLFGDSRKLLFERLEPGAIVIIDGPKGFRALRLALQLLRTGKVRMVFIHDVYKGVPTRAFLEHHVPTTIYSDQADFVERFRHLDAGCWEGFAKDAVMEWHPPTLRETDARSYGPTFACLPYDPSISYARLLMQAHLASFRTRAAKSINKRFNPRRGA